MKRQTFFGWVLGAMSLFAVGSAQAFIIDFVPSSTVVSAGNPVSVSVVASGLGGQIVSGFDIDVTYDASLLTPAGVTLGSGLGDPDPLNFETDSIVDTTNPGVVDIYEISYLTDAELAAIQTDPLTLATIDFVANADGTATFGFIWDAWNDVKGRNNQVIFPVPEPATALLFAAGLGLLGWRNRKHSLAV